MVVSAVRKKEREGRVDLCIPLAVACLEKVLTPKTVCSYESAVSIIAVVRMTARITRVRKHL